MAGELILIANDEPDIRAIMADRLRFRGFEVETADDGHDCVDHVERRAPHLVILDVRMPRMDGLQVLDWMEAHRPRVPVLMVSASADRQVMEASLARGVVDFLIKPFDARMLETKESQRSLGSDGERVMGRILIVVDDRAICVTLADRLQSAGHRVLTAADGREGLRKMREEDPDVVLLDLQMPQMTGLQVLEQARGEGLTCTVVVITAHGSIERAVEAVHAGAFDFIPKPFEPQRIGVVVDKALEHDRLRRENAMLREQAAASVPTLIGDSPPMREVAATAQRAAASSATVLILGSTGSGKEVLARNIHHWSERREAPFVVLNCVAVSEQLLESELFGHERGGFTGAERMRRGRFEQAQGGTIFLDEIGVTQTEFQLKLLRVLQDGTFSRVGGDEELKTDARVLAATSRDPEQAVADGTFLEDLYYRLKVVQIEVPHLRDRRQDIPALAAFFLESFADQTSRHVHAITPAALDCLAAYDWPGCVRELRNTIERAVVLGTGSEIEPEDLPSEVLDASSGDPHKGSTGDDYQSAVRDFKRQLVETTLARTDGNQTEAAQLLGLHRTYLSKLMKDLGLR